MKTMRLVSKMRRCSEQGMESGGIVRSPTVTLDPINLFELQKVSISVKSTILFPSPVVSVLCGAGHAGSSIIRHWGHTGPGAINKL